MQQFSGKRKAQLAVASTLLVLLLIVFIGEIIMRVSHVLPRPPYDTHDKDALLGWKTKTNYHFETQNFADNKGGTYPVNFNLDSRGFRMWNKSSVDSVEGSVLVLGDSYVECVEADDRKVFYAQLHDSLPLSVYAYGVAGYGTHQQFLFLQKYIDTIKPDWVVLQMCANDYIDNYWALQKTAGYHSADTRPYVMLDNTVEYHSPALWFEKIKNYSYFLGFLAERLNNSLVNLGAIKQPERAEDKIAQQGHSFKEYDMACKLTEHSLIEMKKLVEQKGAKFVVLILGYNPPANNEMVDIEQMCERNHIATVTGAEKVLMEHASTGETIRSYDNYHYNHNGQQIIGNVLVDYFKGELIKTN